MTIADILGCGSATNVTEKDHFYATPSNCVTAFLRDEWRDSPKVIIWEPCAGAGDISKVLMANNFPVISTDLVDRGFCESRVDFLMVREKRANVIITNPPFKLARQFLAHAFDLGVDYVAFLLPSDFLCCEAAARMNDIYPCTRIHAMTWRPDFTGQGRPSMKCSWFVWVRGAPGTRFLLMRRP